MKQILTMKQTDGLMVPATGAAFSSLRAYVVRLLTAYAAWLSQVLGLEVGLRQTLHLMHAQIALVVFLATLGQSLPLWLGATAWMGVAVGRCLLSLFPTEDE